MDEQTYPDRATPPYIGGSVEKLAPQRELHPNMNQRFPERSKVEIQGIVFTVLQATNSNIVLTFSHYDKRRR